MYAVALSSTVPGTQYTVRFALQTTAFRNFVFLPMPVFRRKALSRCSCLAGENNQFCKHLACAMMFCLANFDRLGDPLPDVSQETHALALALEKSGDIHCTFPFQRSINRPSTKYKVPEKLAPLVMAGYISPSYDWAPRGLEWWSGPGEFGLRVKGG